MRLLVLLQRGPLARTARGVFLLLCPPGRQFPFLLRLDAIAYLFERDGIGGESLPETIEFVEKIRSFMDAHYPDAVLIAEANQPPAETMQFYGKGERFHMVFNFPVMPRLYQALALADATPVYSILDELPALP